MIVLPVSPAELPDALAALRLRMAQFERSVAQAQAQAQRGKERPTALRPRVAAQRARRTLFFQEGE